MAPFVVMGDLSLSRARTRMLYSVAVHTVHYSTIFCIVLQYIIVQYTVQYSLAVYLLIYCTYIFRLKISHIFKNFLKIFNIFIFYLIIYFSIDFIFYPAKH